MLIKKSAHWQIKKLTNQQIDKLANRLIKIGSLLQLIY